MARGISSPSQIAQGNLVRTSRTKSCGQNLICGGPMVPIWFYETSGFATLSSKRYPIGSSHARLDLALFLLRQISLHFSWTTAAPRNRAHDPLFVASRDRLERRLDGIVGSANSFRLQGRQRGIRPLNS